MATRKLEVVLVGNASQLQGVLGKAETGVAAFGKRMEAVGAGLTRHVSVPILGVGAASVKMGMDFHRQMEMVHADAGASQKEVEKMGKAILELGGKVPQGPRELAHALYDLESVGVRGKTALAALTAAAKGAAIGNTNLGDTTSSLASTMVAYHLRAKDAGKTMGELNAIVGVGKMRMADLNAALASGVLPTARAVGLKIKDVGAALATMTDAGVPAEQAAQKLRTAFFLMAAPTKKATDALASIGLGQLDVAKAMRGPGGIVAGLQLIKDHMDGLSKTAKVKILSDAFGGSRSAATLVTLVDNLDRVKSKLVQVDKGGKQFGEHWAATSQTAAVKMQMAWSKMQAALINFGDILTPVVLKLASVIYHVTAAFDSLSPAQKHMVVDVLAIGAALGPALVVLGKFVQVVSLLRYVMVAGRAAATAYRASMVALTAIRFGWAALSAQAATGGTSVGKMFATKMSAVVMAGIAGWEIGSWISKHVPAVRHAADAVAKAFDSMFGHSGEAQAFDAQMQKITGSVQTLANTFKKATDPATRNAAALRLHEIAARAAAAQWGKLAAEVAAGQSVMDPTTGKVLTLKAAMDHMRQSEQQAATAANSLTASLNAIPRDVAVNIHINRSAGGNAAGGTKHGKLAGAASVHHVSQLLFPDENRLAIKGNQLASLQNILKPSKGVRAEIRTLTMQIKGLDKLIAVKNTIRDIRNTMAQAAKDAAGVWRKRQEDAINDVLKKNLAAISNGKDAQELAALQSQDAAEQDAKNRQQLADQLAQAQAAGDVQATKDAQQAIDDYNRQVREQQLQDAIQAAQDKANADAQAQTDSLDQQEKDYEASLATRFTAFTDDLAAKKDSYAAWAKEVNDILSQYGLQFEPSADQEAALTNGGASVPHTPGGGKVRHRKPRKHRAMGGPVTAGEAYIVGEQGEETFVPNQNGRIIPHGKSSRQVIANFYNSRFGSNVDVDRALNKLAFRLG